MSQQHFMFMALFENGLGQQRIINDMRACVRELRIGYSSVSFKAALQPEIKPDNQLPVS
jgi:hypothetical protein